LVEQKGYAFLLDVLARVPAARRPAWDIVWDDQDAAFGAWFRRESARRGVTVHEHHRPEWALLLGLYRQARVVLCASYREPFGLVPLEAMGCGTPLLAIRDGGFAETVADGVTGQLLPRDAAAWSEALEPYLRDDLLIARQGAAARAHVEASWSTAGWVARLNAATGLAL
jgi:glycosyltransferase involved in cell wall biosynthesis